MDSRQPDRAAWLREALDRYGSALTRYAARLIGDDDRARDVVQDTFVRLCAEEPASLNGRLAEWLYTVCRNRAVDVVRKEKRMTALSETQAGLIASDPCVAPPPPAVLETRESAGLAIRLLAALPENQQEVVRLKFQHGLKYKQIAEITGLSVSNVGFLIHTAIKALRERMG